MLIFAGQTGKATGNQQYTNQNTGKTYQYVYDSSDNVNVRFYVLTVCVFYYLIWSVALFWWIFLNLRAVGQRFHTSNISINRMKLVWLAVYIRAFIINANYTPASILVSIRPLLTVWFLGSGFSFFSASLFQKSSCEEIEIAYLKGRSFHASDYAVYLGYQCFIINRISYCVKDAIHFILLH